MKYSFNRSLFIPEFNQALLLNCNVTLKNQIITRANKKEINKYNKPCLFHKITDSNKVGIKLLVDVNTDIIQNEIYFANTNTLVLVDFNCLLYYLKQNNIKGEDKIKVMSNSITGSLLNFRNIYYLNLLPR